MKTFKNIGRGIASSVSRQIVNFQVKHIVPKSSRTKVGFHVPIKTVESIFPEGLITTINLGMLRHSLSQPGNAFLRVAKNYFIGTGDWSEQVVPVVDILSYREIRELYNFNLEYKNTSSYEERVRNLERGKIISQNGIRFDCIDAINCHFENQIHLIQSITKFGYIDRQGLRSRLLKGKTASSHRTMRQEEREREICVAVGSTGELFLFRSGHHRLAVAHALNLETIPVQIHLVHWEFLAANIDQQSFDIEQIIDTVVAHLEAQYVVPLTSST